MACKKVETHTYAIPINEAKEGGTATVLSVSIEDRSPRARGKILQHILQQNYGLCRAEAIKCLRAMQFDNIII